MSRKLRILCLHGYRQSEVSFREKTGGLRKALKSLADFGNFDNLSVFTLTSIKSFKIIYTLLKVT